MSDPVMNSLGILNKKWGVCGFTSTFYAMYAQNPATRGWLINATQVYSVLYEICDYLRLLQGAKPSLLRDIETFTKSFGPPFDTFTIDGYIGRVESASEQTCKTLQIDDPSAAQSNEAALIAEKLFGIAMPPHVVADYVERCWKWKASVTELAGANLIDNAIVGVRNPKNTGMPMYHGLCHYLYRGGGKYFSWGREIATLKDANPNYEIVWAITLSKP